MGGWKLKAALTEREREEWLVAKTDFARVEMLVGAVERLHNEADLDPGVLWAAARIVEFHDEPTLAAELLTQSAADITRATDLDRPFIEKALQ